MGGSSIFLNGSGYCEVNVGTESSGNVVDYEFCAVCVGLDGADQVTRGTVSGGEAIGVLDRSQCWPCGRG